MHFSFVPYFYLCNVLFRNKLADEDEVVTSSEGEDIKIDTSGTRRRKRQVQNDFELTIETTGGNIIS